MLNMNAKPRKMLREATVVMNAGIRRYAVRTPFHRPRPAPMSTVARTATARGTFMNLSMEASIMVSRAIADPGKDRFRR